MHREGESNRQVLLVVKHAVMILDQVDTINKALVGGVGNSCQKGGETSPRLGL